MWVDRSISLQAAYVVADQAATLPIDRLFGALDRFHVDYSLVNEDSQRQRSEATQKICAELDARNLRLRDPAVEEASIRALRERLGFSPDGKEDFHPQKAEPAL